MGAPDDEATKAFHAFYDALEDLLRARGIGPMLSLWHQADHVSTVHPFGHWARGWKEVSATWQEGAEVFAVYKGHEGRSDRIGGIHDLRVSVHGDLATATGVYRSKLYMSDGALHLAVNCTNLAERVDGRWKIILHHADQAPGSWQAAIGKMVERGRS